MEKIDHLDTNKDESYLNLLFMKPRSNVEFSCAEPNANKLKQRILLLYIRFGAWEERRLKRALAAIRIQVQRDSYSFKEDDKDMRTSFS